ncbi:MAG: hypothetical protein KF744_16505 [Taibaiella sp.]|nr:hypothetical protein [Taibaiella sp.]
MTSGIFRSFLAGLALLITCSPSRANKIFIPMDAEGQVAHLKAYGIAYAALQGGLQLDWLLNYKGGSFGMDQVEGVERMCKLRGVSYEVMSDAEYDGIVQSILDPDFNGDVIKLEKAPKIAVYTPPNKEPWDDAVTLVLTYAEIPFDKVYDDEVLKGDLAKYDWLHLHHEDFTGQYGKFWYSFHNEAWYQHDQKTAEESAKKHGFKKVSQLKLAIAQKIRDFTAGGGYLFAMCSATDSYDIALAAEGVDICESMFDGDGMDPNAQKKLDYSKCFAFKDFQLVTSPMHYEYSTIDNTEFRTAIPMNIDYFSLFTFSAKFDPVPAMLCQNHTTTIKGFMGQTTAFRKEVLKSSVLVMGEFKPSNEARYIHGEYGKGTWTFYGGHDPEDYQHMIHDPVTDLNLHPTSPGYRLILNNVLFPAAKKKPRKT